MLDDRKSAILRAVVQQYIETAQPVGSSAVADRNDVGVSSATVRNDMTVLERDGYLVQPHTSAGRIPTEKAYRFFVDGLGGPGELSPTNVRMVRDFFRTAHGEIEQRLRETSHLLSTVTGTAAVIVAAPGEAVEVRAVQLVDLSPTLVLVVAVLSDGTVIKRSVDLADDLAADELAAAQSLINAQLTGTAAGGAPSFDAARPGASLASHALDAVNAALGESADQVFVDGASRIASSFNATETIEAVLGILEQQYVVVSLLKDLVDSGLRVAIGSETGVEPLAECSLVVAPYGEGSEHHGAIAVLGPTRMNYPETLSAVAVVSQRLNRMLTEG
ncbi:MAG: heat-inducible transcriptional repressor HrcA [Actinomycetes bacterium]